MASQYPLRLTVASCNFYNSSSMNKVICIVEEMQEDNLEEKVSDLGVASFEKHCLNGLLLLPSAEKQDFLSQLSVFCNNLGFSVRK
ncbi:hypothetical protein AKO1_002046 [Acrasis kona]|uniref:Uncharacterized protein n=1 Tax=Acrasis kona TaxID=1008807 RepID=A0AAW2YPB0_9EUKA